MRDNPIKRTLESGGHALGTMVFEFFTPGIAQICRQAGAEFVIYDMEHSASGFESIRAQMSFCRGIGLVPIVRVPASQYDYISRALDAGAMGIMVPMVETPEQAAFIVQSTRYPPSGRRGAAFGFAHDDFTGGDVVGKIRAAHSRTLVICLIETAKGIENADKIAATDGVDICWLGHFDLTNFLGIPGAFADKRFVKAVDRLLAACRRHGKVAGFMAADDAWAKAYLKKGFRIIAYGVDVHLLQAALKSGIEGMRKAIAGATVKRPKRR